MGQVVKCPACRTEVELPAVTKPGKKYLCPDCDTRLPVSDEVPRRKPVRPALADDEDDRPAPRTKGRRDEEEDEAPPPRPKRRRDDDDEDDDRPRKKKRKGEAADKPFWKSRMGKILSGLGFLAVGVIFIVLALFTDAGKPLKLILVGVLAILVGFGSLGYGFFASDDDSDNPDDSDDEGDDGDGGGGDD